MVLIRLIGRSVVGWCRTARVRTASSMPDHDDANIVFIGSRAGNVGVPWMPAYAAVNAPTTAPTSDA